MNGVTEYVEAHEMQRRDAADVVEEFTDEILQMRGKCIDIGCGPATLTRELLLPKLPPRSSVLGECGNSVSPGAVQCGARSVRIRPVHVDLNARLG